MMIPYRFHRLKILSINQFYLRIVRKDLLMHLVDLEELNLSQNKIEIIKRDAFSTLKSLRKLDLSNNDIEQLKPGVFDYLTNLEELNLSENSLSDIIGTLFENLTSLKKLDISRIKLKELKNGTLSRLINLQEINIEYNDCAFESDPFSNLRNLNIMKLAYKYTLLPKNQTKINRPCNLKELHYYYMLGDTPHLNWISKHSNLKLLNLSVGFNKLNASFFNNFTQLEELIKNNELNILCEHMFDGLINLV